MRAFEALARRHQAALYRTAVRVTGDPAEAEDALQEALLDAWRHLDRFRGDAAFSTWMYRLVTNRCVAALRRRRPVPAPDAGDDVAARRFPRTGGPARPRAGRAGPRGAGSPGQPAGVLGAAGAGRAGLRRDRGDHRCRGDGRARPHPPGARPAGGGDAGVEMTEVPSMAEIAPLACGRDAAAGVGPRRGGAPARRARARTARTARPPTPRPGGSTSRCTAWPRSRSRCPPPAVEAVLGRVLDDGAQQGSARGGAAARLAARAQPARPRGRRRGAARRRRRHGRDARPQLPHRAARAGHGHRRRAHRGRPVRPGPGVGDRPGAPDGVRGGRAGVGAAGAARRHRGGGPVGGVTLHVADAAVASVAAAAARQVPGVVAARAELAAPSSCGWRSPIRLGDNCRDVAAGRAAWGHPHVGGAGRANGPGRGDGGGGRSCLTRPPIVTSR